MATFLSSFFPDYAADHGVSNTVSGLIFSGYPIGMFLTSLVATRIILKFGIRQSIIAGMLLSAISILAMGFVPSAFGGDACDGRTAGKCAGIQIFFVVFYSLAGMLGAISECACFIALQNWNKNRSVAMVASGSLACGIGCMVGPELGGIVYDLGRLTPFGDFLLPFVVFSIVPTLLCVPVYVSFPEVAKIDADKQTAPISSIISTGFILTWIGYALNGTIVATLDPTLATKLSSGQHSFNCSSTVVGLIFMLSSVVYTLLAYPVGHACDTRWKGKSRTLKWMLSLSMFFLFLCFAVLGPFRVGAIDFRPIDGYPSVLLAMTFKGIGSSLGAVAYADMIIGIDIEDDVLQATVVSLNNAAYAVGWGVGPIIGGGLMDAFHGSDAMRFSGFSTVISIAALSYGLVLFLAPFLLRNPAPRPQAPIEKLNAPYARLEGGDDEQGG